MVFPDHTHLLFVFVTCFAMHYYWSFLVLQSFCWGRESWFFLMSSGCYCSVAFPRGAVGRSAVCDCGIS